MSSEHIIKQIALLLNRIVLNLVNFPGYDFYEDEDDLKYYIDQLHVINDKDKIPTFLLMNGVNFDINSYLNNCDINALINDIKLAITNKMNEINNISNIIKEKLNKCFDELKLTKEVKDMNMSLISQSFLNNIMIEEKKVFDILVKEGKICLVINGKTVKANIFKGFGDLYGTN